MLARIAADPWWPALIGVFLSGALWLVASAAGALGVKQFALAFMLQAAIITVVGRKLTRELLFPLAFLLFAVPAGEIFVPTLIEWTADFTVNALRWSGVPVYREANYFIIPWESSCSDPDQAARIVPTRLLGAARRKSAGTSWTN